MSTAFVNRVFNGLLAWTLNPGGERDKLICRIVGHDYEIVLWAARSKSGKSVLYCPRCKDWRE